MLEVQFLLLPLESFLNTVLLFFFRSGIKKEGGKLNFHERKS